MKTLALALLAAASLAAPALADVAGQLAVAQTHAGLAAKAAAVDGVHMHLHHALNCLVGPGGAGFDAGQANPCAKAGNGALPEATDAGQKAKIEAAATKISAGIAATDLAAAQTAATEAAAAIGAAK
jgi:hypothetical protein